jgi:hypothetical protein
MTKNNVENSVRAHRALPKAAQKQAFAVSRNTQAQALLPDVDKAEGRIPADCSAPEKLPTGPGIEPCSALLANLCTAVDSFVIQFAALRFALAALRFALAAAPALSANEMQHVRKQRPKQTQEGVVCTHELYIVMLKHTRSRPVILSGSCRCSEHSGFIDLSYFVICLDYNL